MLSSLVAAARRALPSVSDTEREALEAGTVWLDGDLFSGRPSHERILEAPYPALGDREREFLAGPVREVCDRVDPWRVETEGGLPSEVWSSLAEEGFFGLTIPREYGGLGFSALAASTVYGALASRSLALSAVVLIPNSVGPGELLLRYGTPEQQDRLLPRLARGREIPCFALTEPRAGSDAAALESRGAVFRGADGTPWLRLSFEKRYITLAPVATLVGLAIRLEDPDEILGRGPAPGITVVLLPSDTPGVEIGRRHDPMGIPFPNGPISGSGVEIPASAIVGEASGAGRGWGMLMEALSGGRAISLPAQSAAGAKAVARVVGAYATVRRQFGRPIGDFEGVAERVARVGGLAYLMEAARVLTCGGVDAGERPAVISAIVKQAETELLREVARDGMDVLAGAAICRGPRNLMARAWIGAPIGITVEGANILTRTLITFGQGVVRSHPRVRAELAAIDADDGGALLRALAAHAGSTILNGLRTLVLGLSRGRLARAPVDPGLRSGYRRLLWATARFAFWTDVALVTLGGRLKKRGALSGRFADVLSWLYLGFATVRRFEAEGRRAEDLPLARWATEHALGRIQEAHLGILRNLDVPGVSALARGPASWWSRLNPVGGPIDDRLSREVAESLRRPGAARDRLTRWTHLPSVPGDPLTDLERAFELAVRAEPLRRRLRRAARDRAIGDKSDLEAAVAAGVLDADEARTVADADEAAARAVAVDDFPPRNGHRVAGHEPEAEPVPRGAG